MTLITSLSDIPFLSIPTALTLGNFDGIHLGHQYLLHHLKTHSQNPIVVLTFSNHPAQFFSPDLSIPPIYPLEQKVKLLLEQGVSFIIQIPFTTSIANLSFNDFLTFLQERLRFSLLVLGEGSAFGHGRKGDAQAVNQIAPSLNFKVDYLPKLSLKNQPISSRRIRKAISSAQFEEASLCLGRAYSLEGN